jgi:hypothetical protein
MNTLFVVIMWSAFYYLFFGHLTAQEWREWSNLEEEFTEVPSES